VNPYWHISAGRCAFLGFLTALFAFVCFNFIVATAGAAGPAEVEKIFCVSSHQTSLGPCGGNISSKGLETLWRLEYSSTPTGPWTPIDNGVITQTEAEVTEHQVIHSSDVVTGLMPETTYFIRLITNNSVLPEGVLVEPIATSTRHPTVVGRVEVSDNAATSVHVSGLINPSNFDTRWRFEYATTEKLLAEGHGVVGSEGIINGIEADESTHKVEGDLAGLSESSTYFVRVIAENEFGQTESVPVGFETGGGPLPVTFTAHSVEGEVMRVLGSVEPHGYDTHYFVEYVPQADFKSDGWSDAYKTPVVDAGLGEYVSGQFPVSVVGVGLPGLDSGGVYLYRLVASSTAPGGPVVDGTAQVLRVPVAGETDSDIEEGPVSSSSCGNEAVRIGVSGELPDCRAYEQVTPVEKGGAQDTFKYGATSEGSLVGSDGDTRNMQHFMLHVPGVEWGPSPDPRIANYFFARTSIGWQMMSVRPQGSTGPDSYHPFLFDSDLKQVGLEVEWETSEVSVSPNIELGSGPLGGPYVTVASIPRSEADRENMWVAGSADFSKLIFQSKDYKLLGHVTGTTVGDDLYEFSDGELRQVNVGIGGCGARMANGFEGYEGRPLGSHSSARSVSADGSRVFFESVPGSECSKPSHLYMRTGSDSTVDIGEYVFLAANNEGTKLLLEKQESETQHHIVEYDVETGIVRSLFSTPQAITGDVVGGDPVVSPDLSTIYFFSMGDLTPDAPPPLQGAGLQRENLFRFDVGSGVLSFVAQSEANAGANFTGHSVSKDGRYFYWVSGGVAGVPGGAVNSEQVYRFDSVDNMVQCMSCASPFDPVPKLSARFLESGGSHPVDGVPGSFDASDNGDYVFFDTPSALVSGDVDGEVAPEDVRGEHPSVSFSVSSDVYEWRKDGVGGCVSVEGCVALISSGTGGYKNVFLGTTESGGDVFFASHDSLVASDTDTAGDVYDARIGGGFPAPPTGPVECEGDACQSPMIAPIDTTPTSLAFSGQGNVVPKPKAKVKTKVKACRKGMVRKRGKCVKPKHAKRARSRDRAGRSGRRGRGGQK
jgi:hypothetical protein